MSCVLGEAQFAPTVPCSVSALPSSCCAVQQRHGQSCFANTSRLEFATIPAACAPQRKKPALKNAKILKSQIAGRDVVQGQTAEVPANESSVLDANAPSNHTYGKKKPTLKNAKILKEQLMGQHVGQVTSLDVATRATVEDTHPQGYVSAIKSLNLEPVTSRCFPRTGDVLQRQSLEPHKLCQESMLTPLPSPPDVSDIAQPVPSMHLSKPPLSTAVESEVRKGCKVKNMRLMLLKTSEHADSVDDSATDSTRSPFTSAASSPEQTQVIPAVTVTRRRERQVHDRAFMLGMWQSLSHEEHVPSSVQGLYASRVEEVSTRQPVTNGSKKKKWPRKDTQALVPGEGAYRPFQSGQDLERNILALLNKISPENFHTIVDRFAAVELKDSKELSKVIKMIFDQVLRQPFYCETYADMVQTLQVRYQATPFENGVTFRRLLISACQEEFENLSASLQFATEGMTSEEVLDEKKKRKDRVLANMKFIGYLYLRQMLALKVIGNIVQELINFDGSADTFPQEEHIECALQLLQAVGCSLDQRQEGQILMTRFISRLTTLKTSQADGRKFYSKRVQFQIQDLVELRSTNWEQ